MRMYSLLLVALALGVTLAAQAPVESAAAPRTPWGHPDLQGTYSNDDETGTPMERPAQFAGKRQEDLTPEEFARLVKDRNDAFVKGVEGTEFAGARVADCRSGGREDSRAHRGGTHAAPRR